MYSFSLRFPDGNRRALTFSYDDAVPADIRLAKLMKKYGVKGTFNANSWFYHKDEPEDRLSKAELKALADDPQFEVACHGHTHPYYNFLPQPTVANDIIINRKKIEEITGSIIRGFAYPYGPYTDLSEEAIKVAGIVYARTTKSTSNFDLPENWLQWHPTCHHTNAPALFEKFMSDLTPLIKPLVMYVWGHSFEFDRENNWDFIEDFLKKCSQAEGIWFATNMEIYNYVNAFNSLVFSADGNRIFNPTRTDLWALCNANWKPNSGKIIKIPAGETVTLEYFEV